MFNYFEQLQQCILKRFDYAIFKTCLQQASRQSKIVNVPMYNQRQQPKPKSWEKYDSILFGIGAGIVVPFIGLAVLMMINESFAGLSGPFTGFTDKLIRLLAIILNLLPFSVFNRKRMLQSMRGVFIPTFIYALIWLSIYNAHILAGEF